MVTVDGVLGLILVALVIVPGFYYICGGTDKPQRRTRPEDRRKTYRPPAKPRDPH